MDDQQHALSALLFAVPILEAAPIDLGHPAPSWWFWLIVVLGVLNPFRIARSTPISDRRTRLQAVALGGAIGAFGLALIGSTSGWLLDAVDASRPAMRLAAASLCLLTAGIDLATRRATADAAGLPGRRAALVPVAIPLVIRPALVFAAISIVADHGVTFLAAALALGVAGAAIVAGARDQEGPVTARIVGWVQRLLSSAAVVAAALLIAHAVFDI